MRPLQFAIALTLGILSGLRVEQPAGTTSPSGNAPALQGHWRDGYDVPGVSGNVQTAAVYGSDLVVGGSFEAIGPEPFCALARWDGASFHALGGVDGFVWALVGYDTELVAVGLFDTVDQVPARNVATWNGSAWRPLGPGTDGVVQAAGVFHGQLVVGGAFDHAGGEPASSIAAWDGVTWSPLGAGTGRGVLAIREYQGQLWVGGRFTTAGGTSALRIARWDGASWTAIGANGIVRALHVWNGMLVAGGDFTVIGGVAANRVAAWDGTTWRPLGAGADGGIDALATYEGSLVASGRFARAGESAAEKIASWDGSAWHPLGAGIGSHAPYVSAQSTVATLQEYRGELIAGGTFGEAGGVVTPNLARWDGDRWARLVDGAGLGSATQITGVVTHGGTIVASGADFLYAGQTRVLRTASWDGQSWTDLESPFERPTAVGTFGEDLVEAGQVESGDEPAHVAELRDGVWQILGPPFDNPTGAFIHALEEWDARLLVGGDFISVGGQPIRHLAAWDGSEFHPLGSGPPGPVRAILALGGGGLVVGGSTEALPSQAYVARWDGVRWEPLGGPFMGLTPGHTTAIAALAEYRGAVVAAGQFLGVDGEAVGHVARWDGAAWRSMNGGVAGSDPTAAIVRDLAVYRGRLVAAGTFVAAGGVEAGGIAAWNGSAWSRLAPLDGGCGANVPFFLSLAVARGSLFASGGFASVGETVSAGIAEWAPLPDRSNAPRHGPVLGRAGL